MTPLVQRALADEGLLEVLEARRRGEDLGDLAPKLETADLLALGALADLVRAEEVGPEVALHVEQEPPEGVVVVRERGQALLRAVAIARVTGRRGARVCVDFGVTGLEIGQVALGFGASELAGPIANRRGLPIAEDAQKKVKGQGMVSIRALKREELATLVRRAGREPVFADPRGAQRREPTEASP
ncbi:MAG TPA: hypothetical protein VLM85_17830 [Polyangiaceae bacterium]|nr:hypothetical protein [Polyangiaceae bacterium]